MSIRMFKRYKLHQMLKADVKEYGNCGITGFSCLLKGDDIYEFMVTIITETFDSREVALDKLNIEAQEFLFCFIMDDISNMENLFAKGLGEIKRSVQEEKKKKEEQQLIESKKFIVDEG